MLDDRNDGYNGVSNNDDDAEGWELQQPLMASPLGGRRSDVARVLADQHETAAAAAVAAAAAAAVAAAAAAAAVPGDLALVPGSSSSGSVGQQGVVRPRSIIPATRFHSQAKGGRVQLLVVDDDTVNHQVGRRLVVFLSYSLLLLVSSWVLLVVVRKQVVCSGWSANAFASMCVAVVHAGCCIFHNAGFPLGHWSALGGGVAL
jgi:hypothetical protein